MDDLGRGVSMRTPETIRHTLGAFVHGQIQRFHQFFQVRDSVEITAPETLPMRLIN